jgi:hypothetical protein
MQIMGSDRSENQRMAYDSDALSKVREKRCFVILFYFRFFVFSIVLTYRANGGGR